MIRPPSTEGLTGKQAQAVLARAWQGAFGAPAEPCALSLLTAQWALETDTGRQMHGYNFAGIKASPSAPGASFHTAEGYGAERREVVQRVRVYGSVAAGAEGYVLLLAAHYPNALLAARSRDASSFAGALAAGGYVTADPNAYARGLEQRVRAQQGGSAMAGQVSPSPHGAELSLGALWNLLRALRHEPDSA
ncbi:MAG TPA: glucosaminidase domain-containing protein [Polyangiaceae bacterium]|nr:glucosaminidase domain-containing protein [Polyangiaceae bacterium]